MSKSSSLQIKTNKQAVSIDVRPEPTPPPQGLSKVEEVLREHFHIQDWQGIRLALAIAAAHYVPGEPLWVKIISASRGGKTEILRAIKDHEDCEEFEYATPSSLRGGHIGEAELVLNRLLDKLVITLDMAPMLGMRKDKRLELFALLRAVKDGSFCADYNTPEGHVAQSGTFDWIVGCTPAVEAIRQLEGLLGERFIDLQWQAGDREEMALRAIANNPKLPEIRRELGNSVQSLLLGVKEIAQGQLYELTEKEKRLLAKWANAIAICRSPILRDSRGEILSVPKPEFGTSLGQDFARVSSGLQLIGIGDWKPYIRRLAWDCIPTVRASILRSLPNSVRQICKKTEFKQSTVYHYLEDLELLHVVGNEGEDEEDAETNQNDIDPDVAYIVETSEKRKALKIELP